MTYARNFLHPQKLSTWKKLETSYPGLGKKQGEFVNTQAPPSHHPGCIVERRNPPKKGGSVGLKQPRRTRRCLIGMRVSRSFGKGTSPPFSTKRKGTKRSYWMKVWGLESWSFVSRFLMGGDIFPWKWPHSWHFSWKVWKWQVVSTLRILGGTISNRCDMSFGPILF